MPHKCMRCKSVFKDGTAIILDGCPHCGWNKFLYVQEPETKAETISIKEVNEKEKSEKSEVGNRVESIRILSPGSYELNLESLLEREEIVALKEDGTYVVHLPSVFKKKKHHER